MSDLAGWLALLAIPSERVSRGELMSELLAGASPEALLARPLPGGSASHASLVDHARVSTWLRRMEEAEVEFLPLTSPTFPATIGLLSRPPLGLFVKGRPELLHEPAIAMVGTRRATAGGCRLAREMAADLATRGWVVASGLAEGIDAAAHRGALDASGDTIAVLGAGIDVVYPPGNEELQEDIGARGLLVSEYAPGAEPLAAQFPARNRLVVALSRAVVVIEAGVRSGALITAEIAHRMGVPVFAIPGLPGEAESVGTNGLLKRGRARLVETTADVLRALESAPAEPTDAPASVRVETRAPALRPPASATPHTPTPRPPRAPSPLLARLGRRAVPVDVLASELGRPVSEILAELLRLELDGLAEAADGGLGWKRSA